MDRLRMELRHPRANHLWHHLVAGSIRTLGKTQDVLLRLHQRVLRGWITTPREGPHAR